MNLDTTRGTEGHAGSHWHVSKLNYAPAVRQPMHLPSEVRLCDVTLREGTVQAGVKFTPEQECELAQELDAIGIPFIGLCLATDLDELHRHTMRLSELNLNAKLVGSVHPFYEWKTRQADWKDVVNVQIDAGAEVIEMMYFLTHWRLQGSVYQEKMTVDEIIERMNDCISYVKDRGAVPFVAITDTARVDIDLVKRAYRSNVGAGAGMVAVNDSFGAMIPPTMKHLVAEVKAATDGATVKVHCHNDTGLALANSLAAVEGGADIVDGALNGYGDRGFADLTAVAVNLTINYGFDLDIDLSRLYGASKAAEEMTRMPIPPTWPLIGEYAFATSHELHHHAMEDNYWSGSVLDTRLFGKTATFFLTSMSGPITIRRKLAELGLAADDDMVTNIVARIKEADVAAKGIISDDDVRRIAAEAAAA
jgi:2-isopropylmalate synthase